MAGPRCKKLSRLVLITHIGESMKKIIQTFLLLMVSQLVVAQDAPRGVEIPEGVQTESPRGFIELHNAIESQSLRISMDDSLNGFIEGKVCDECDTIKVTITPDTKAFDNNVEVPLKRAKSRLGRYATVIYVKDTMNVSAIHW